MYFLWTRSLINKKGSNQGERPVDPECLKEENKTEDDCRCLVDECHNGDVACDSYNKIERDIELLDELNVQSYRFSLSWSRLLPSGTPDKPSQNGIDYYMKLIDGLKARFFSLWVEI